MKEILILLSPIINLLGGVLLYIYVPAKPNSIYGYRTKNSMKNEKTWKFANKYSSKIAIIYSIVLLIISLVLYFTIYKKYTSAIEWIYLVAYVLESIIVILMTERKLKQLV